MENLAPHHHTGPLKSKQQQQQQSDTAIEADSICKEIKYQTNEMRVKKAHI